MSDLSILVDKYMNDPAIKSVLERRPDGAMVRTYVNDNGDQLRISLQHQPDPKKRDRDR